MTQQTLTVPQRTIPIIGTYDVVVCGAGMAGIGAAIAAARSGAQTALVEPCEVLGGLGASGGVGNFSAGEGGQHGQREFFGDFLTYQCYQITHYAGLFHLGA